MTVDGYRCSGSPSAQEIGQNNRDVQRDEVVNINDFKLKLTTVSGIEYSDPLRVDPDIVHSTLPPLVSAGCQGLVSLRKIRSQLKKNSCVVFVDAASFVFGAFFHDAMYARKRTT